MQDIRWIQRFENFQSAFKELEEAVDLFAQRPLSKLEKQGLIQAFEFTFEMAWNVLKDYLVWQSVTTITGSRDAIREAFKVGLISDGHAWIEMLQDRNRTVHTYNEETADSILQMVVNKYAALFIELRETFSKKAIEVDFE